MKKNLLSIIFIAITVTMYSCSEIPTESSYKVDPGTASDYFPLKTGNWWLYTVIPEQGPWTFRRIVEDTIRHQDGNLLYKFADHVDARVPYVIVYWYAIADSGVLLYNATQDSVLYNNQWILTKSQKIPLLMNPIVEGNSWTSNISDSLETYRILSVGPQYFKNILWPVVVTVVHDSPSSVDTSWYIKNYGLVSIHKVEYYSTQTVKVCTELDSCLVK